ncbi:CFI-box-CTERM domain-containing protein [Aquirufa originis]|uniref:CFI-box-CTERM domain-containing protein n=1 Tax=Aquirufa originis TaxID=3096514 RepID=UPI00366FF4CC
MINRTRFKTKEEFIHLEYIEKVNLFPPVKQSSNSNCFVVTTTMGDKNHPIVVDFRKYRDQVLLQRDLGRLFIKLYYKIGPILSYIIKNNKILFKLSKWVILKLHQKIS